MPNFTSTPPAVPAGYALRIVRTPAQKPITGIVTSTDLVGCATHYTGNRTVPCEGQDHCKACQDGLSWRWHGYLGCILTDTLEHVLFEFTATASDTFQNYYKVQATMRGCHFRASRPSGKHNGRVVIACKPYDQSRARLPDPPDVEGILCHIWGVPRNDARTHNDPERTARTIGLAPGSDPGNNRLRTG